MKRGLLALACCLAASAGGAADWAVSADGAYVIDVRARLAWPRCIEGMSWNGGACAGTPQLLDHAEAQALAVNRWKAESVRWRLPTSHELKRLAGHMGTDLFPGSPGGWYWSGSATVNTAQANPYNYGNVMQGRSGDATNRLNYLHGWAVNLSTGEAAGDVSRRNRLPVRLVRPAF